MGYYKRYIRKNIMKIIKTNDKNIKEVSTIVTSIIDEIVENGNEALKSHIEKFDKWEVKSDEDLAISQKDMKKAYDNMDEDLKKALHTAYDRIKTYHEKQLPKSWIDFEKNGTI